MPISCAVTLALFLALPLFPADPAPTAAVDAPSGVLEFRIEDDRGGLIPGRLTFVPREGGGRELFPNPDARPDDLAVRRNVVYCLSGAARITVPAGVYDVYATRGLEWSRDHTRLEIDAGAHVSWSARLTHEVDTSGWVSGDFHLHTLTYSGHGDSNLPERIISIVGEGIEFAVATDHNHHTDYHPTIASLDAGARLAATTGNEVSVPIGHFNAFPLDPKRVPVDGSINDAHRLFRLLRAEPNAEEIVPVIQVNHPRWSGIDYFELAGLDAATGAPVGDAFAWDFDTIEVLNENVAWGYYTPFVDDVPAAAETQSVLHDWFNLLNRGRRYAAVGNSDSHTVHYAFAGYPRNFIRSETDDPAAIDTAAVAHTLRRRGVFTTTGPFVEFTANGAAMGSETAAPDGVVEVTVRVQAASWVDCDRVIVVVNGKRVETIPVPDTRRVLRLEARHRLTLAADAWICLLVEGDDDLAPIVEGGGRAAVPLAVTNPIWVDVNGDGRVTSVWDQARTLVRDAADAATVNAAAGIPAEWRLLAAVEQGRPFAGELIAQGLVSEARPVRLAAARGAESLGDASARDALTVAMRRAEADPYLGIAVARALASVGSPPSADELFAFVERHAGALPSRYLQELVPILPGHVARAWMVLGYFPAPEAGAVLGPPLGPENDANLRSCPGPNGTTLTWQPAVAGPSGHLDLRGIGVGASSNAIAFAELWLHRAEAGVVPIALGTDDGCRVYLNDAPVYDNPARRGASPLEHLDRWRVHAGWNRVLFKVENGTGGFGLYFRVFDDAVTLSANRPS